jgi:hypothetical protein
MGIGPSREMHAEMLGKRTKRTEMSAATLSVQAKMPCRQKNAGNYLLSGEGKPNFAAVREGVLGSIVPPCAFNPPGGCPPLLRLRNVEWCGCGTVLLGVAGLNGARCA